MPQHNYDPKAVTVSIPVFTKGDYEFIVGECKAFSGTNAEGNENFGIRWPMKVAKAVDEGDEGAVDKRTLYSCYMNGGAAPFGKAFAMACLGYQRNEEGETAFDEDYGDRDWGFNSDNGICGDGWKECIGKRVVGAVSVRMDPETGRKGQQWEGFRPLTQ